MHRLRVYDGARFRLTVLVKLPSHGFNLVAREAGNSHRPPSCGGGDHRVEDDLEDWLFADVAGNCLQPVAPLGKRPFQQVRDTHGVETTGRTEHVLGSECDVLVVHDEPGPCPTTARTQSRAMLRAFQSWARRESFLCLALQPLPVSRPSRHRRSGRCPSASVTDHQHGKRLSGRPAYADQAICLLTSSLNTPSTSMSSLKEPCCTTFPACST